MKKIFGLLTALLVAVAGLTSCVTTYDDKDYGIENPTVLASNLGNYEIPKFAVTADGYTAKVTIPATAKEEDWGDNSFSKVGLSFGIVYGTKDDPKWTTKYTAGTTTKADGTFVDCTLGSDDNNCVSDFAKGDSIVIKVSGTTVSYKVVAAN